MKLGFYPAPPEVIPLIASHLVVPEVDPEKATKNQLLILDPCAGEGEAIHQLGGCLGMPDSNIYTIELDHIRSGRIRDKWPESNHLGPAGFHGTHITPASFGCAYVNPPFDNELSGGKREEQGFVERSTMLLVPGGVLVLVCPESAIVSNRNFIRYLDAHYEDGALYRFPTEFRRFKELVYFGRKRKVQIPGGEDMHGVPGCALHAMQLHYPWSFRADNVSPLGQPQPKYWTSNGNPSYDREESIRLWQVPKAYRPHIWRKTAYTEMELIEAAEASPLNRMATFVKPLEKKCPPLPLDRGHIGLLLASGELDGKIDTPHGPHVVRGSSHKQEYYNAAASTSTVNDVTGAVTTKEVFSQRPITVIRTAEPDGIIRTFSNEVIGDDEPQDMERNDDAA